MATTRRAFLRTGILGGLSSSFLLGPPARANVPMSAELIDHARSARIAVPDHFAPLVRAGERGLAAIGKEVRLNSLDVIAHPYDARHKKRVSGVALDGEGGPERTLLLAVGDEESIQVAALLIRHRSGLPTAVKLHLVVDGSLQELARYYRYPTPRYEVVSRAGGLSDAELEAPMWFVRVARSKWDELRATCPGDCASCKAAVGAIAEAPGTAACGIAGTIICVGVCAFVPWPASIVCGLACGVLFLTLCQNLDPGDVPCDTCREIGSCTSC